MAPLRGRGNGGGGGLDQPLQLVRDVDGRFEIPEDTAAALQGLKAEGPFAVLATVGRYRTGKSLLANRGLLQLHRGQGFGVGTTVQACTKGIWVYPQFVSVAGTRCLVLDTEGTSSVDATADEDSRLVTLAMLLSSTLIFNSVGCLDEMNLSQLGSVALAARVLLAGEAPHISLIWCLRDFSLQLPGSDATEDAYLDRVLSVDAKSDLRECLRESFRERRLFTFVRPCNGEQDLQNANNLPDSSFRPEFRQQLGRFRQLVAGTARPRCVGDEPVSPAVFVGLAQTFAAMLNERRMPTVLDTFGFVVRAAADRHLAEFEAALATFAAEQELPRDPQELRRDFEACFPPLPLAVRGEALARLQDGREAVQARAWASLQARGEEAARRWLAQQHREETDHRRFLREAVARVGAARACEAAGHLFDAALERAEAAHRRGVEELRESLEELRFQHEGARREAGETRSLRDRLEALQEECCAWEVRDVQRNEAFASELQALRAASAELAQSELRPAELEETLHERLRDEARELERARREALHLEEACRSSEELQARDRAFATESLRALRDQTARSLAEVAAQRDRQCAEAQTRVDAAVAEASAMRRRLGEALSAEEACRESCFSEVRERHMKLAEFFEGRGEVLRLAHDEAVAEARQTSTRAATVERELARCEAECSILKRKSHVGDEALVEERRCRARNHELGEQLARRDAQLEAAREALEEARRRGAEAEAQARKSAAEVLALQRQQAFEVARLELRLEAAEACR
jgi:hypothetical protein